MTNLARYTNGHLFRLYPGETDSPRTDLETKLGAVLGGMTETDYRNFDLFAGRARELGTLATAKNCKLYVDAEQTFI